ncbi:MAG TPA: HPr family phosphocarrier protein [Thermoanaerobaculia bacterium]|nr:HPr family phosphocarrier protein [Thermoanaerobaculia bacterium]HUM29969.1 HPr family phosphocarrier protein [Thermoanaerobaculia bacterium]HXK68164.1 HPr family phosphocarrier protein [Thermoanaerobaculia bacterium]
MITKDIEIINKLGLHARAAAKLVETSKRYACSVTVSKDGEAVDGKSILGILMLAAAKGSMITVVTDGEDEESAMNAVEELILDYFGEGE